MKILPRHITEYHNYVESVFFIDSNLCFRIKNIFIVSEIRSVTLEIIFHLKF